MRIAAWSGGVVVGLATVLTACSSSSPEPSSSGASSAALSGAYMPKATPADGRLSGIVFTGDRYRLRRAPCDDGGCEEVGTFKHDPTNGRLELTAEGGKMSAIAVQVVSSRTPEGSARPAGVGIAATQLIEAPAQLLVADQVLLDGESYENESDLCEGQKIFNGTATYTTRTYWGNDNDRKRVGDIACGQAREDADKQCKKSPWVCTATPTGTTALPPDCTGALEITCKCSASTKCNYSW